MERRFRRRSRYNIQIHLRTQGEDAPRRYAHEISLNPFIQLLESDCTISHVLPAYTESLVDGHYRAKTPEERETFSLVEVKALAEDIMDDCRLNKAPSDPVSTFSFQVRQIFIRSPAFLPTDLTLHIGAIPGSASSCGWKSVRIHSTGSSATGREPNRFPLRVFPPSKNDESLCSTLYVSLPCSVYRIQFRFGPDVAAGFVLQTKRLESYFRKMIPRKLSTFSTLLLCESCKPFSKS